MVGGVTTWYPYLVKWSHAADPGALPVSWDEADPRYDTGEVPLSETDGEVVGGLQMRDMNVVYKTDAVYGMQYVGGTFIFRFAPLFTTFGALNRNCMAVARNGEHIIVSRDDVILHNGQSASSLMTSRIRKSFISNVRAEFAEFSSFIAALPHKQELWVCVPLAGNGSSYPMIAYVWNWQHDTWSIRDLEVTGFVATGGSADNYIIHPRTLRSGRITTSPYLVEVDYATSGTLFPTSSWSVERTGLGIPFDSERPPDLHSMKFLREVRPRIEGTVGATVSVEVGTQEDPAGAVTWQPARTFTIGTTTRLDYRLSARLFAIRLSGTDFSKEIRLHGFDLDVVRGGAF